MAAKRKAGGYGITNSLKEKERPKSHQQGWKAKQRNKKTIQRADQYPGYDRSDKRQTAPHRRREAKKRQGPDSRY